MAYDETLAARVRARLAGRSDVSEKTMFGGIAFMVRGHMTVGLNKDDLVVRVAPEDNDRLLEQPHTRPMDFTGRPMRGWLSVEPEGVRTPRDLGRWVDLAIAHAEAKPLGAAGAATRSARPKAAARRSAKVPAAVQRAPRRPRTRPATTRRRHQR